jgi:CRP-like cAMP-binding protein
MDVMSELQRLEQIESFPSGSVLFREGEAPCGVYVIHSGNVDLVFSGRNGVSKPLRSLHAGAVAGLSDAVANVPHDCTATTRSSASVGFVPIGELRQLLDEKPAVWFDIAEVLSEDLDECWGSMRTLAGPR